MAAAEEEAAQTMEAGTRTAISTVTSTVAAAAATITPPARRPVTGRTTDVIRIFGSAVATTAVLLIGATRHREQAVRELPEVDRIIKSGIMEVQR